MNTQEFLLWEARSRDTIDVKRCYIDVAGDLVSGVLLSQIIYWHLPDEQGRSKLRVHHDGHDWVAKKRTDWWDECRVSAKQFDRAADALEKKGLVVTHLYRFDGSPTKHIRMNWEGFFEALKSLQDTVFPQRSNSKFPPDSIFPKGQNPTSANGKLEMDEKVRTITETPTKITPKTTLPPTPQGGRESVEEFRSRNGGKNLNSHSAVATLVKEERVQTTSVTVVDESSAATRSQIVEYSPNPDEQFKNGRKLHPQKNTYMSKSSDPWMEGNNPIPVFKMWVLNQINRDPKKVTNLPNVAAELRNNYQRAQDWWEQFLADTSSRFEVLERRVLSGSLPSEQELEELSSVASYASSAHSCRVIELAREQLSPSRTTPPLPPSPSPTPQESVAPPISEEEAAANLLRLKEMMAGVKKLSPPPQSPPSTSKLDQLNADLADPCIGRSLDIQAQARRFLEDNVGYAADYDQTGNVISIMQF